VFNIIARNTLLHYCATFPDADIALRELYHELLNASFSNFNELKAQYASASLVGDDRVVFNIMGNRYRLVVRVVFAYKTIQIKWFGTHAEYDKTDVTKVIFKRK
jgi:mRNA interferase HigB